MLIIYFDCCMSEMDEALSSVWLLQPVALF